MNRFISALLLILPLLASAQRGDTIIHTPSYSLFKQAGFIDYDTVNRIHTNGQRTGRWIEYDSGITNVIVQPRYRKLYLNDSQFTFPSYTVRWSGMYINGKKEGVWIDANRRVDSYIHVLYRNGEVQMPVVQYVYGNKYNLSTYDKKQKKYRTVQYDQAGNMTGITYAASLEEIWYQSRGTAMPKKINPKTESFR